MKFIVRVCLLLVICFPLAAEEQGQSPSDASSSDNRETVANQPASVAVDDIAESSTSLLLDEVSVIAKGNEVALNRLPESVSVITEEKIAEIAPLTVAELVEDLPNVTTGGGPRQQGQKVIVRGIGGSRLLYTVDGSRQTFEGGHRGRFFLDPELIRRVEIIRGPASARFGSGAIAGVLAIETRTAEDLLMGSDNQFGAVFKSQYRTNGDVKSNNLIGYGQLGDFDFIGQLGHRENDNIEDGNGDEIQFTADELTSNLLKLGYDISEHQRIDVTRTETVQENISPSRPEGNEPPIMDKENTTENLRLAYRLDLPTGILSDVDINAYQSTLDLIEDRVDGDEERLDTIDFDTTGFNISADFRLPFAGQSVSIGSDGYRDEALGTRNGQPRPQFPQAEQTIYGAFAQYQYDKDRLYLSTAARYDNFSSKTAEDGPNPAGVEEDNVSGLIGASYELTDFLRLHASYGEAFRAPSLLESYASGQHFPGNNFEPNPNIRPEKAANSEVGFTFDTALLDGWPHLELRANFFENKIEDFIELVVDLTPSPNPGGLTNPNCFNLTDLPTNCFLPPAGRTTFINLPAATIRGYETVLQYYGDRWGSVLTYGSVRGRQDDDGNNLANIPADEASFELNWTGDRLKLGTRIQHFRDQNRVRQEEMGLVLTGGSAAPSTGYTVGNVFAQYQATPALSINAGVDNITDRAYRHHLAVLNSPGRSFRLGIRYQL